MLPLLLLTLLACSAHAVPHFYVDLDVKAEERWKEVITHFRDYGALQAMARDDPDAPHPALEVAEIWLESVGKQLDPEYEAEIRGWVKYGGPNITRDFMVMTSAMYEMNYPSFCSGLLAAMPDGTVVHGRNLDYPLNLEINGKKVGWPELTVDVTFMRDGRPLMTSVTWPFQLGIHTAMRIDGWSFEQNTRRTGNDLKLNTDAVQQGGETFGLVARRVMESVPDFETAVNRLWSANVASSSYFIMAGKGPFEAAVLSMDRGGVHGRESPSIIRLSEQSRTWNLVQTNDDRNHEAKDHRRPDEEKRLANAAQTQVSPEWVFSEMRAEALKNDLTVFTWVAVPKDNFHKTVLPSETWAQAMASDKVISSTNASSPATAAAGEKGATAVAKGATTVAVEAHVNVAVEASPCIRCGSFISLPEVAVGRWGRGKFGL